MSIKSMLLAVVLVSAVFGAVPAIADETCQSPYLVKITG